MNKSACVAFLMLGANALYGYEMPVHARITQEAFARSDLTVNATELFLRLGFDRLDANHPFQSTAPTCTNPDTGTGDAYLDADGGWLVGFSVPPAKTT